MESLVVLLGLTPLNLHIQMGARWTIFKMRRSVNNAESYLNRRKIDMFSRLVELLILIDSTVMRFHLDKKFEAQWNNNEILNTRCEAETPRTRERLEISMDYIFDQYTTHIT